MGKVCAVCYFSIKRLSGDAEQERSGAGAGAGAVFVAARINIKTIVASDG